MGILELELLNKRQASSDNIVMSKTDLLQAITILKKKHTLAWKKKIMAFWLERSSLGRSTTL